MKNKLKKKDGQALNYLLSLIIVLAIASILIVIQDESPLKALSVLVKGAVGAPAAIASSIRWSIPVIIATMAAVVAQKSGINNLGLDGQIYFSAFMAGIVGAFLPLPRGLHIGVTILVGGIVGLVYTIIPALLKIFLNINEMIVTLMLNYIAILFTEYFTMQMMGLNTDANPDLIATPEILPSAALSKIIHPYQASTGIFIAIAIVVIVTCFYRFTRTGYEWTMLGRNSRFAQYGGVRQKKGLLMAFLLSGFIAGVCGSVEIIGAHHRFRGNFASNLGWDGIMVALIAKNNPVMAFIVAVLWGMIKAGSMAMERETSVNRILITLIQALFVLFITVDFKGVFQKYRARFTSKKQVEGV